VSLSADVTSVTSSVEFCLPVQIPVKDVVGVTNVTLAAVAVVGLVIGVLVAVLIGWILFKHCLSKVGFCRSRDQINSANICKSFHLIALTQWLK